MRRPFYFIFFHCLIAAFILIAPNFVLAITVGPAKMEYRADPGTIFEGTLVLINEGDAKRTFWPAFEKFTEINGEKKFLPSEPTELANWIKLPESVTLEPAEQRQIPFTIEIPQKAPPGGHFAVIWWGTAPPDSKQVSIVTRAGILVYLRVSGEINEAGKLTAFSTVNNNFFFFQLPKIFNVGFKNIGNTYLKPRGEILIKNIFGGKIAVFNVNGIDKIFLPDTESALRVAKNFEKAPFTLGFYKAGLSLHWGEKPELLKKDIWFFVFPWKHVLVASLMIAILFWSATKGIKKYNQRIIAKYTKKQSIDV